MTSWRDVLPIHAACDLFPMMSPEELRALGEDIKKNGLKNPVVQLDASDEYPYYRLLDGRNRLDAMEAVGMKIVDDDGEFIDRYRVVRTVSKITDPFAYVLSLNIHRRHLTTEQRRDLIAKVLKAKPETSNRQIAKQVKADDKTVGKVRRELEATAEVPQLGKTVGADGKARSTKPKTSKPVVVEKPKPNDPVAERANSDKPAPVAVAASPTLFEPDIESARSDEGLNASQLKSQNKRLRAKLKSLRNHMTKLEEDLKQEKERHEDTWCKLRLAQGVKLKGSNRTHR